MRTLTLDLLRHGETATHGIYQGRTDVLLSEKGERQMAGALSCSPGWQRVLYSPLTRCAYPAQLGAGLLNVPCDEVDWLSEIDFGEWDGRMLSDVHAQQPELVEAFWQNPADVTPPGGESLQALQQRISIGREQLLHGSDEHLLLVTHGGVIRALVAECLQIAAARWTHIRLDHACFTRIRYYLDEGQCWPELVTCNTPLLDANSTQN